jgi:two-component system sensor histidine kinase UhpB
METASPRRRDTAASTVVPTGDAREGPRAAAPRWITRLLRIPLLHKILLANSLIVALGATGGTALTVWHVHAFPGDDHLALIVVLAAAGLTLSFVVNYAALRLALTPLDRLQSAVDRVRRGDWDARVEPGWADDERFARLADTFDRMLTAAAEATAQARQLSQRILAAQEDERQRVARELHDQSAQSLTSMLVRLRMLERADDAVEARAHVQELRDLTARALEDIRRIALELRPKILEDLGLGEALAWRADELNASGAVRTTLRIDDRDRRLPKDVELALYRIAQESLTNITRHARARTAELRLEHTDDAVRLTVQDDGVGFDVAAPVAHPSGLGVSGMHERMALVGGRLTIDSAPGGGTRVIATVPLAQEVS